MILWIMKSLVSRNTMSPVVAVIVMVVMVVMVAVTSIYNKRDRRLNECICIMLFPVTKTLDEQWNGNLEQRIASAGIRENAA